MAADAPVVPSEPTAPSAVDVGGNADAAFDAAIADVFSEPAPSEPAAGSPPSAATEKPSTDPATAPATNAAPASPGSTAPSYTDSAKGWLDKYNGDINKALEAAWEANNRAAQAAQKLKEKESAAPPQTPEPQEPEAPQPAPVDVPEAVRRFDQRLGAYDAHFVQIENARKTNTEALQSTDTEIADLRHQIRRAGLDTDTSQLREKLDEAMDRRDKLAEKGERFDAQRSDLIQRYRETKDQRDLARQLHDLAEQQRAREEQQLQAREAAEISERRQALFGSIDAAATEAKIPEKHRERFRKYTLAQAAIYLNGGEGRVIEDPAIFAAETAKDFLEMLNDYVRDQHAQFVEGKAKDAAVPTPEPSKAVAPPARRFRSINDVREFEETLDLGI